MTKSTVEYVPAFTPDWTDPLYLSILADAEEERGQYSASRALREIAYKDWRPFETETLLAGMSYTKTFDWYGYLPGDRGFYAWEENSVIPRSVLTLIDKDAYDYEPTSDRQWRCFLTSESAYIALIGALISSYREHKI